jgi:hypothetical protein
VLEPSADVCLWHKADMDHAQVMSAFGGKADMEISERDVCF